MGFSSVRIFQFRNLEDTEILFADKDIFLVGENGQGKTNFLESIYLLCVGSSFRTKNESILIKSGYKDMALSAQFNDAGSKHSIQLKLEKGRKNILIDGKKIKDRKELLYEFPCIAFTHDDINFVNGPPSLRRLFINQTISLFDGTYLDSLRTYNRVIKLRNIALKTKKISLLDVYDQQAAYAGIEIQQKRLGLINEFNTVFTGLFKSISGADIDLTIRYSPSWKMSNEMRVEEALLQLQQNRSRDLTYGTTTSGLHRDRVGFYANGRNYASTASTGQIRLISLVLRASQAAFTAVKSGKKPMLLLDDVLLEMDFDKRKRFLKNLPDYKQAFFTFLPDEGLINYHENGPLYRVKNGKIHREVL